MAAFLAVAATVIQTRQLVGRIFHRRREPRHCSGEMFATRQVFHGFLDLLTSLFAFRSEVRGQTSGQNGRHMFRYSRCVFVHKFLKTLLGCLTRFLFSIAMIHSSFNTIGHRQRFGRCCLHQNRGNRWKRADLIWGRPDF